MHMLREAFAGYLSTYRREPHRFWQGINAVALAARAAREGISLSGVRDPATRSRTLAKAVLKTTATTPDPDPWSVATDCEANVALGEFERALRDAKLLVSHRDTTPFQVNALLRQLTDIWQLDAMAAPGAALLPVLRSDLLDRDDGAVTLGPREVAAERTPEKSVEEQQERVLGADRFRTLTWYRLGLDRCRAVCRIQTRTDDGFGTGFLMDRAVLGLGTGLALVTNAHVIPDLPTARSSVAAFMGLAPRTRKTIFEFDRILWSSPAHELDTTVLLLKGHPRVKPIQPAEALPNLEAKTPPRAYVIGHPLGRSIEFSLHDNKLLAADGVRLHYRSPTEQGNSGSPVFNSEWALIGLHHAGSETTRKLNGEPGVYPANEAIRFSAIRAAIRSTTS